jgi:dephospho-CoA kinase
MGALKIGLTGGVCCGKSTALEIFARHGFEAVNLDQQVRDALQGNEKVKARVKQEFGQFAQGPAEEAGAILTRKLDALLSDGSGAYDNLENLIYPEIDLLWAKDTRIPSVVEAPFLFEKNLNIHFHLTICVYASYPLQVARAKACRGWNRAQLDSRLAQQFPLSEKMNRSDFVIGNNGTLLQFERQIQQMLRQLEAMAQARR